MVSTGFSAVVSGNAWLLIRLQAAYSLASPTFPAGQLALAVQEKAPAATCESVGDTANVNSRSSPAAR